MKNKWETVVKLFALEVQRKWNEELNCSGDFSGHAWVSGGYEYRVRTSAQKELERLKFDLQKERVMRIAAEGRARAYSAALLEHESRGTDTHVGCTSPEAQCS